MNYPLATEGGGETIDSHRWKQSLKIAFRSRQQLAEHLGLCLEPDSGDGDHGFPLFVTREFVGRMRRGDRKDPLLLQVWPDQREGERTPGFLEDPVGDLEARQTPGLLQKYEGRVLLMMSGACAIHCRYCFRRHYPYAEEPKSLTQWEPALARIQADRSIQEVILSGGDPLMAADETLAAIVDRLDRIRHLERLRLHTRLPIVLPSRVNPSMLDWLQASRLSKWVVVHCNHPQEIDESVVEGWERLRQAGAVLLNQAVLLRGVNDDFETLASLCRTLVKHGVLPYYLHAFDPVQGAAHFDTPAAVGVRLVEALRRVLPGFAVPQLVREVAHHPYKQPLA
jgi:EF-P beta-lysylation protein EpmB